jgi:biopolymer transport protein ExbB
MSLIEIFKAGGPVMWPLALCSLVSLAIVIERSVNLRVSRILNPGVVERITGLAEGGSLERAIDACRQSPGIYTNIVTAGLEVASRGEGKSLSKEAIEDAGRQETARLNRYMGTLGTIVGISPLLGLLGTVAGMLKTFSAMSLQDGLQSIDLVASGISEALITTETGLSIAIVGLVLLTVLRSFRRRLLNRFESCEAETVLEMQPMSSPC